MLIYNSLTGKKESIKKPRGRALHFFVCGPTVYDSAHLGHARTAVAFDIIVKFLRSITPVVYIQNITDVDDKIIARSRERKISPFALSRKFEQEYKLNMGQLGVDAVDIYARATDFIPAIVAQVTSLIKKGYAYEIAGDGYYFDISKFKNYGKLSHRTALQAEDSISRIDDSKSKRNKGDFCLWKSVNVPPNIRAEKIIVDGEPAWRSTLGYGRPGWHIEDTAITESFFGPQYDIHGGGLELKFPHHEAEIAQQESASGKSPFVNIWMHTGSLLINGVKMSKSLGNFVTISDFLKKYENSDPANLLRIIFAGYHYRSPMNFTDTSIESAIKSLSGIKDFISKLEFVRGLSKNKKSSFDNVSKTLTSLDNEFEKSMLDDFNTPDALATIFKTINAFSPHIFNLSSSDAEKILKTIVKMLTSLGIAVNLAKIPRKIALLAEKRELCRRNKQFIQSDDLREKIHRLGYEVEDTPLGGMIKRRK